MSKMTPEQVAELKKEAAEFVEHDYTCSLAASQFIELLTKALEQTERERDDALMQLAILEKQVADIW